MYLFLFHKSSNNRHLSSQCWCVCDPYPVLRSDMFRPEQGRCRRAGWHRWTAGGPSWWWSTPGSWCTLGPSHRSHSYNLTYRRKWNRTDTLVQSLYRKIAEECIQLTEKISWRGIAVPRVSMTHLLCFMMRPTEYWTSRCSGALRLFTSGATGCFLCWMCSSVCCTR